MNPETPNYHCKPDSEQVKSDTPETDANRRQVELAIGNARLCDYDFARKLERERDEARRMAEYHERNAREFHAELFGVRQANDQLRARVEKLEKDKERLDWLARTYYVAQNSTYRLPWNEDSIMGYGTDHTTNIRQAIDKARKGDSK